MVVTARVSLGRLCGRRNLTAIVISDVGTNVRNTFFLCGLDGCDRYRHKMCYNSEGQGFNNKS